MIKPKHPQATHLPSPPPSPSLPATTTQPSSEPNPTIPSLTTHLDALLTSYLLLLDTYTTLRAQLSSTLSSGFLSLASANRNAATILGPGRRFGEEGFDGRMRAGRHVKIRRSHNAESGSKMRDDEAGNERGADAEERRDDGDEHAVETDTSPTDIPSPYRYSITPISDPPPRDPLKWFTALPPPALRQTQQHFIAALDPVTRLLEVSARMTAVEERVRAVRRELVGAVVARDGVGDGEAAVEEKAGEEKGKVNGKDVDEEQERREGRWDRR